jgi:CheY-like chemotaxis protein
MTSPELVHHIIPHGVRPKPTVLVIDDDPGFRQLMCDLLHRSYVVETAGDGLGGYSDTVRLRPAVVILDLRMPVVDGLTVLRKLRSNPVTASTPVVVLSGATEDVARHDYETLNVSAVLQKPATFDELRRAVARSAALLCVLCVLCGLCVSRLDRSMTAVAPQTAFAKASAVRQSFSDGGSPRATADRRYRCSTSGRKAASRPISGR